MKQDTWKCECGATWKVSISFYMGSDPVVCPVCNRTEFEKNDQGKYVMYITNYETTL